MLSNYLGYEFFTFVFVVVVVELLERLWPVCEVNRGDQRLLNVFALLLVAVGSKFSSYLIGEFCQMVGMERWFLSLKTLRELSSTAKIVLAGILIDFCLYWIHRGMHQFPLLWRAHKFHHTPQNLFWLSGSRTSFLHLFIFAIPQLIIPFYLLTLTWVEAGVLFSLNVVVNIWIHSNVRLSIGWFDWLIITPAFHRIHHSAGKLSGKNLGFVHTLWDRIFGTFVDPMTVPNNFRLGLADDRIRLRTVIGF